MNTSKYLTHHGLVAAFLHSIQIIETIDAMPPEYERHHKVTDGQLCFALILNGLDLGKGCAHHELAKYLSQLPIGKLFKDDTLKAEFFTRDAIARMYDRFHQVGLDDLYETIAMIAFKKLNLVAQTVHIDTTSIHLHGTKYDKARKGMISKMNVKYGYSCERRPDLPQIVHLTSIGLTYFQISLHVVSLLNSAKIFGVLSKKYWKNLICQGIYFILLTDFQSLFVITNGLFIASGLRERQLGVTVPLKSSITTNSKAISLLIKRVKLLILMWLPPI